MPSGKACDIDNDTGLRIADAPTIARIANANIDAPCLMIGERAAAPTAAG